MFSNIFENKKVLITGNTGFKGSWLTIWLHQLGATPFGLALDIPTQPSIFEALQIEKKCNQFWGDIQEPHYVQTVMQEVRPDFIFHLAAQSIVSRSYSHPLDTVSTNVLGTANILEGLRRYGQPCIAVIITSDKCYDNVEWVWGYRETDTLGGKDVYSGSKGAAELIFKSYYHSFFKKNKHIKLATARAGNVIGGGDWARDRIVADCMRAWSEGKTVEIRHPKATRPWQHVLEPLSGYLNLAQALAEKHQVSGQSYNFSPTADQDVTVLQLLSDLGSSWSLDNKKPAYHVSQDESFHEAGLLKLDCSKVMQELQWQPTLSYNALIEFTSSWYQNYYNDNHDMFSFTSKQIQEYQDFACQKDLPWTK